MQHPDEGTIHSWLDNALSAEEATRVESHIAECPQCAAAVAEARGFIAASSRILTALDDVPRGVVPVAQVRGRHLRVFWRVAAAMLVVAGGSLVVLRESGQDARMTPSLTDSASLESKAATAMANGGANDIAGMARDARTAVSQSDAAPSSQRRTVPLAARVRTRPTAPAERNLSGKIQDLSDKTIVAGGTGAQTVGTDTTAPTSAAMNSSALSRQQQVATLKVVRVERAIGRRSTVYEVTPTDTVTLTELESFSLSAVVTGVASGRDGQSKERTAARPLAPVRTEVAGAPLRAAPPTESSQPADSVSLSTEAAGMAKTSAKAAQVAVALVAPLNTISWTEAATGKTLTLSGKLSVERLQEIKRRIEMERAATRKNP